MSLTTQTEELLEGLSTYGQLVVARQVMFSVVNEIQRLSVEGVYDPDVDSLGDFVESLTSGVTYLRTIAENHKSAQVS